MMVMFTRSGRAYISFVQHVAHLTYIAPCTMYNLTQNARARMRTPRAGARARVVECVGPVIVHDDDDNCVCCCSQRAFVCMVPRARDRRTSPLPISVHQQRALRAYYNQLLQLLQLPAAHTHFTLSSIFHTYGAECSAPHIFVHAMGCAPRCIYISH